MLATLTHHPTRPLPLQQGSNPTCDPEAAPGHNILACPGPEQQTDDFCPCSCSCRSGLYFLSHRKNTVFHSCQQHNSLAA